MCGIFGFIDRSGQLTEANGRAALAQLNARGPDSTGTLSLSPRGASIFLGHKRLSIIDLSEAGSQPMRTQDDRFSLVYNGEIYNFPEIRKTLETDGIRFRGHSDTEVLLHGFARFGVSITEKLNGMFAYAMHDADNGCITLARDHFGKKPLYYYSDENIFSFSSEPKALMALEPIRKKLTINPKSLTKFLYYGYVPSPHSIFSEIKKLDPASILKFDIESWTVGKPLPFWDPLPKAHNLAQNMQEPEILERVDNLINGAVKRRMISDVPLGIFLSGGIDSSLVANALSQYSSNISAITVSYPKTPEVDETQYARYVSDKLGLNLITIPFEENNLSERFLDIINYLDEPIADAATAPLHSISMTAKNHMTVALSGDGGDEIFGGYPKYRAQSFIENLGPFRHLCGPLKHLIPKDSPYHKFFSSMPLSFEKRNFIFGSGAFLPDEVEALTGEKQNLDSIFEDALRAHTKSQSHDTVNRALYLDCQIQLPDWYLVKTDRATMAASLEARSPFLDKDLVEFAFSLKGNWKIRNGEGKYLLKKLAEQHFKKDFVYRPKKGFGAPLHDWIQNAHRDLFYTYLFKDNGHFNLPVIRRLYDNHMQGRARNEFKLFRIFAFNYWLERFATT